MDQLEPTGSPKKRKPSKEEEEEESPSKGASKIPSITPKKGDKTEKSSEKSPGKGAQKSPVKSLQQSPEKGLEKSNIKSLQKSPEKGLEKSITKSSQKSPTKDFERSPDKNAFEKSPTKVSETKSTDKSSTMSSYEKKSPSNTPKKGIEDYDEFQMETEGETAYSVSSSTISDSGDDDESDSEGSDEEEIAPIKSKPIASSLLSTPSIKKKNPLIKETVQQPTTVQVALDQDRYKNYIDHPLRGGETKEIVENYRQAFKNYIKDPSRQGQEWQFIIRPWISKKSKAETLVQIIVQAKGDVEEYFNYLLRFSEEEKKSDLYSTEILDWINGLNEQKTALSHYTKTQDHIRSILSKRLDTQKYSGEEREEIISELVEIFSHETIMALLGKEVLSNWKTPEWGPVLKTKSLDLAVTVQTHVLDKDKSEISLALTKKPFVKRSVSYSDTANIGKSAPAQKGGPTPTPGGRSQKRKLDDIAKGDYPCTICTRPEKAKSHRTSEHIPRSEQSERYRQKTVEKQARKMLSQPVPSYTGTFMPQQSGFAAFDPTRPPSFNIYDVSAPLMPLNQYGSNVSQQGQSVQQPKPQQKTQQAHQHQQSRGGGRGDHQMKKADAKK